MDIQQFFKQYKDISEEHLRRIEAFLKSNKELSDEHIKNNASSEGIGFNVFSLVSDVYQRENLHSDIMRSFLDPQESHNQGSLFLDTFIEMLSSKGFAVNEEDYQNAEVVREEGRIDILIKDSESMHCIIIENKINNAIDQKRQIPAYYDYAIKEGYKVDAIIYLPLDENKKPDKSTWTKRDIERITPLLLVMPAYSKFNDNLINSWLMPSYNKCEDEECKFVLKQYINLVKSLRADNMDRNLVGKFVESLKDKETAKTLQSILDLVNDIPAYKAEEIMQELNRRFIFDDPLKLSLAGNRVRIDNFVIKPKNISICIDSYGFCEGYFVQLWEQESYSKKDIDINKYMLELIPNWNKINKYSWEYEKKHISCMTWDFSYEEETTMLNFVLKIANALKEAMESRK